MEEKRCLTCRYGDLPSGASPCKECIKLGIDYEKYWEPQEAEDEEKKEEKGEDWKSCLNCRFCDNDIDTVPCPGCLNAGGHPKWEPDGIHTKSDQEEKQRKRPQPLRTPVYIFDREDSQIPDRIRVSFSDGTTAVYTLHVDQPHPMVMESIRIIRRWRSEGYQYMPPRRRRSRK